MELIPMDKLIDRGVYRLKSRNLSVGVWDAERGGFNGVREKFSSRYIFTEYHYDYDDHYGTVRAMEFLDAYLPIPILNREYASGEARCDEHFIEVPWADYAEGQEKFANWPGRGYRFHANEPGVPLSMNERFCGYGNEAMFYFLLPWDDQFRAEFRAEYERWNLEHN